MVDAARPFAAYTTRHPMRNPLLNHPHGIDVWLATPDARSRFQPTALTAADRQAWSTIRTDRRRRDFEVSRALACALPVRPGEQRSLSHSHGHAALAAATHASVGVDLEVCVPRDGVSLAATAFAADEIAVVTNQPRVEDRALAFYELWVLKEACAKALGRPLVEVLRGTDFSRWMKPETTSGLADDGPDWAAWLYAPRPDLRLAVFVAGPTRVEPRLHEWPDDLRTPWPLVRHLAGPASPWTRAAA